jgi:hypothetical protein
MPVSYGPKTASKSLTGPVPEPDWSEALQNWKSVVTNPREAAVFSALDSPDWDWRTTDGLERDTRLDAEEIQQILGKYAALVRATRSRQYGTVYQLKNRTTPKNEPLIERALDILSMGKRRKIA